MQERERRRTGLLDREAGNLIAQEKTPDQIVHLFGCSEIGKAVEAQLTPGTVGELADLAVEIDCAEAVRQTEGGLEQLAQRRVSKDLQPLGCLAGVFGHNLSTDRAHAVRSRLIFDGISNDRILRVDGYGDTSLKFPDKPNASMNRRIVIKLLAEESLKDFFDKHRSPIDNTNLVKKEKASEAEKKKEKGDIKKYMDKAAGLPDKPLSLDEIQRNNRRKEYFAKYGSPESRSKESSGGSH